MSKLFICDHPLIYDKMARIRDKNTGTKEFRENVSEIAALITYEVTRDLKTKLVDIFTPITKMKTKILDEPIVIVPILRAGLGMIDGIQKIIPTAKIGHIGLYRDDKTLKPHNYFSKFPKEIVKSQVILVDPMLATGNSAVEAINILKKNNVKQIKYVGLVGCPEGIKNLQETHPDVDIFLACCDEKLNQDGYIIPGLGDCGDRLFGTK